ncbi:hypothetical protein AAG587_16975 [Vreelandella neptunia]|jgi:hypothetical protein|uniref:hypothetical protein n=1 Tax=Vreelandella neptunia TaxID=115551 RepID=UPI00315AF100
MTQQTKASFKVSEVIQRLADSGIGFTACHDGPAGMITVTLTPGQLEMYWNDPPTAFASVYGVSRDDYIAWHAAGYMAQCGNLTARGRRCRNAVVDGHLVGSPDRWLAMNGGYCKIHGEGFS